MHIIGRKQKAKPVAGGVGWRADDRGTLGVTEAERGAEFSTPKPDPDGLVTFSDRQPWQPSTGPKVITVADLVERWSWAVSRMAGN